MLNRTKWLLGIGVGLMIFMIYYYWTSSSTNAPSLPISKPTESRTLKAAMQCHQENDGINAIRLYKKAVEQGHINAILPIAQIYQHGIPGSIEPDEKLAYECYHRILNHPSSSPMLRTLATEALTEWTDQTKTYQRITAHHNLNGILKDNMFAPFYEVEEQERIIPNPPAEEFELTIPVNLIVIDDDDRDVLGIHLTRNEEGEVMVTKPSDTQNVHDSTIVQSLKKSVLRLQEAVAGTPSPRKSNEDVRETIMKCNDVPLPIRERAVRVLKETEANNQRIGSLGMSEGEVLNLVYDRIHQFDHNEPLRQSMLENLVREMAEGEERGNVVCATGRATRYVDSLNGVDDLIDIKPTWAIRELMLSKAAQVRQELEAQTTTQPDQETTANTNTNDELLTRITSTLRNEFVDTNQISEERLQAELNEWGSFI